MRCKPRHKRTYGFESCGLEKPLKQYGLCEECWKLWLKTDAGFQYIKDVTLNKVKKDSEKKRKEAKASEKRSKVNYEGKLQLKVQEIARLIDLGCECLATEKMATSYDGGHVWGKQAHRECRFNLHNIFAQSSDSNRSTQDDIRMANGVKRVFGGKYYEFVIGLKNKTIISEYKHTKKEYEQMYRKACKVSNTLKRDGKKYDTLDRLMLRNKYNKEIGCYPDHLSLFDTNLTQIF